MILRRLGSFISALLLSISSLFVFVPSTFAATVTWDGGGSDSNFSTAANWVGDIAPVSGDSLVFDCASTNKGPVNNMTGATFASISFSGACGGVGFAVSGNAFTLTGGVTNSSTGASHSFSNNIVLTGASQTFTNSTADSSVGFSGSNVTFTLDLGTTALTFAGVGKFSMYSNLSGSGAITKNGTGTLTLAGASSSYSGAITISAGLLEVTGASALGSAASGTAVSSGAAIKYSMAYGQDYSVTEPLSLAGSGYNESPTISFGQGNSVYPYPLTTVSAAITLQSDIKLAGYNRNVKITGDITGNYIIGLVEGTQGTLEVASTTNGSKTSGTVTPAHKTTTVNSGDNDSNIDVDIEGNNTYVVNGIRGFASVAHGGILKGTGTVGEVSLAAGGKIAPGLSPGCLSSGNLTFVAGSTYDFEVAGPTECTEYDQIKVTGTVTLGNGTLNTILFNGFKPVKDQAYKIIDNDSTDAVTGTFLNLAEGATFTVDGFVLKISYVGGDGNDVVLTVQSVPAVPDTGFKLLLNNPLLTIATTTTLAAAMLVVARKYALATTRK